MLHRWTTIRCLFEDAPELGDAGGGLLKHLEEQDPRSSSTEPWQAAERGDVFTYHFGDGRGVRWHDRDRAVLWLCALRGEHDGGYDHARRLQSKGRLYPELDPTPDPEHGSLRAWGVFPDEDCLESVRTIYGALALWRDERDRIEAGEAVEYQDAFYASLARDESDIWTLTIRWTLGYQHPESERARRLAYDEAEALFRELAGHPQDFEWDNPPHPQHWMFVCVHFLGGPPDPDEWLRSVAESCLAGDVPGFLRATGETR